jgi:alcohol dehydrogenase (cytochrome c)
MRAALALVGALVLALCTAASAAEVSTARIQASAAEPQNWLTYGGGYDSQRYSALTQITPKNVKALKSQWVLQDNVIGVWQSNPLVVDGVMYVTQRPNDVIALDAKTGKVFWQYRYTPSPDAKICCGANNRGVAILGNTLFMGTLDAHLLALDARTGELLWNIKLADEKLAYSITMAPLVVKDRVVVGVGGGEFGIRGFLAAYDPRTGAEAWRFYTIPGPGEPGHETWRETDWEHGGGSAWVTGSYDPSLNLIYWGIGNPGPDWNPAQRPGDNLYTDSVVALDADTGKLKWHYQFTPNDGYDYDSVQVPVLADIAWQGRPTKVMMWANRNGFFYVLDRATGKFLLGQPFVKVNWASGFDANGRPIQTPQPLRAPTYPGNQGGTNWFPPAFNPRTGLFYFSAWENYASIYRREAATYEPGKTFVGASPSVLVPAPGATSPGIGRKTLINTWTSETGSGAVVAMDPKTGKRVWTFPQYDVTEAGMLTTASGLIFTGGREGYVYALDAKTGKALWKAHLGGQINMAPVTYAVDGRQYVSVIAGRTLVTFALGD